MKINNFYQLGYDICPQLINKNLVINLNKAISEYTTQKSAYGIRQLHHKILEFHNLSNSETILTLLQQYTGDSQFKLIKAIFFNKNQHHNWFVGWHQDKTIAVKEKKLLPDFKNWTIKQGIHHVQPPLEILQKITTIRIALDDTNENNGALKIIPQSHQLGILDRDRIDRMVKNKKPVVCSLKTGDALIMHPLLLHSSSKNISNSDRGVIHFEYSSCDLPKGLAWI